MVGVLRHILHYLDLCRRILIVGHMCVVVMVMVMVISTTSASSNRPVPIDIFSGLTRDSDGVGYLTEAPC